ncbi:uncharacterized protein LOC101221124 [Cucumis sativus]|uniref:NtPRp27-like protein n=1 Tax=Cucumis sativus TaxID=3659 RepID=A0A0A0K4M0_CUCSA|nr:uncharacterized protein LOC101221124 [Cucumis sativus]KGN43894.1 hypothetical protein Csa_017172 [Cucumis sativus]
MAYSNKITFFLFSSLLLLQMVSAVKFTVTNKAVGTPGGVRFDNEIGVDCSRQIMVASTDFIWNIFQQSSVANRKNVHKVKLFIVTDYDGVAFASNNEIHVSAGYIANYGGDVKREITGVLYHEMTHIWQWNGIPNAPGGLIEGIADYVRLKSGYIPGHWVGPGGGSSWDQGYDVTARFLDYLEGLRSGFVAELNRRLRNGYSANYFVQLLGKPVDQLWADYKAAYGN